MRLLQPGPGTASGAGNITTGKCCVFLVALGMRDIEGTCDREITAEL